MNALVTQQFKAQLPAFLQKAAVLEASAGLTGGIQAGLPPLISVKGSKWRIVTDGQVLFVNQMHLDVVVVGFNKSVSKTYFAGEFDENNVSAPDCWSDNGVAPSSRVSTPQAGSCALCPHNAFNSAPNGRGGKACRDSKKLAVVLANKVDCLDGNVRRELDPFKTAYLLQLPTMSMKPWKEFVDKVHGHGVPVLFGIVVRLTFDPSEAYPKISFAPAAQVTDEYGPYLSPYLEDARVQEVVGANDLPFQQATSTVVTFPSAAPLVPPAASSTLSSTAPTVAAPASPTTPASTTPAAAAPAPRKPGRPPKAAAQPAAAPTAAPTPPAAPASPAQGSAIVQPQAATPDLDAMLAGFFAKG